MSSIADLIFIWDDNKAPVSPAPDITCTTPGGIPAFEQSCASKIPLGMSVLLKYFHYFHICESLTYAQWGFLGSLLELTQVLNEQPWLTDLENHSVSCTTSWHNLVTELTRPLMAFLILSSDAYIQEAVGSSKE